MRFNTKGSSPSVRQLGRFSLPMAAWSSMTFSGKGNSCAGQTHRQPNAEGSVHIPYSAQNPGKNMHWGNRRQALRFASIHRAGSAR